MGHDHGHRQYRSAGDGSTPVLLVDERFSMTTCVDDVELATDNLSFAGLPLELSAEETLEGLYLMS